MKQVITILLLLFVQLPLLAQSDSIAEKKPLKIHHAEPLYMDLIRDLGARKGEKEWNVGYSVEGHKNYTLNHAFIEYEFAPINRLGFEVEIPVEFYKTGTPLEGATVPKNRLEGFKLATQYTFLVSEKHQTSMAVGYMHEFRAHSFYSMERGRGMLKGTSISPFFIAAKRWGNRIHSLVYTGPEWEFTPGESKKELLGLVNASMHYVLPSGHFVGVEVNEEFGKGYNSLMIRPQMKLVLNSRLAVGVLSGIPMNYTEGGMSFMVRVIYEPRRK